MEIGDEVTFIPNEFVKFDDKSFRLPGNVPIKVTGKIIQINKKNRWYRVEATIHDGKYILHETFKIGE